MLKLKLMIAGQVFRFEGEAPFGEVVKLAAEFLWAIRNTDQGAVDQLATRLKDSNTKLSTDVADATPQPSTVD